MKISEIMFAIGTMAFATLLMGAAVDTEGNAITMATDLGDIDTDATTVQNFKDVVAPGGNVFFALCSSPGGFERKEASTLRYAANPQDNDFILTNGTMVVVKFANAHSAPGALLNVNNTGGKPICRFGEIQEIGSLSPAFSWQAGEVVMFLYDGAYWQMLKHPYATTSIPGVVALETSTNSTSAAKAATASAVRDVRRYVDTAVSPKVGADEVTNLVWEIYLTSQRYVYDVATETTYRFNSDNDFLTLTAVTNVPPTPEVIRELERIR